MTDSRPYELLARFDNTGKVSGVSIRTLTTVNGRDYESDPTPLSGATDAAFTEFAAQFSAAAVTERDAEKALHDATKTTFAEAESARDVALSQVATLQAQVDSIAGLNQQIATLTAEVARLTALVPPPVDPNAVPQSITRTQARLVLHRAGLLDSVVSLVKAGGIEAEIWFESATWNRQSPVLIAMATELGFDATKLDELFRAAAAIVI